MADKKYTPRLETQYQEVIRKKLIDSKKYGNVMEVPKLTKITLSCCLKEAIQNSKTLDAMAADMTKIAGQKVMITKSKKAISNFKLRENIPLGCSVTLRRAKMWEFLDRFVSVAAPRIRDFKGLPRKSFDGRGNYSMGIKEHTIFPEVNYDKVDKIRGFNIAIGTTAKTDEEALNLLSELGFPFRK